MAHILAGMPIGEGNTNRKPIPERVHYVPCACSHLCLGRTARAGRSWVQGSSCCRSHCTWTLLGTDRALGQQRQCPSTPAAQQYSQTWVGGGVNAMQRDRFVKETVPISDGCHKPPPLSRARSGTGQSNQDSQSTHHTPRLAVEEEGQRVGVHVHLHSDHVTTVEVVEVLGGAAGVPRLARALVRPALHTNANPRAGLMRKRSQQTTTVATLPIS